MVTKSTGIINTVAGNGNSGYSGDGGLATSARLSGPRDVAVDASGNIYIAIELDSRIRMVMKSTGIIMTVASDGLSLIVAMED
jgi:trimeric autotransporter adhesin